MSSLPVSSPSLPASVHTMPILVCNPVSEARVSGSALLGTSNATKAIWARSSQALQGSLVVIRFVFGHSGSARALAGLVVLEPSRQGTAATGDDPAACDLY